MSPSRSWFLLVSSLFVGVLAPLPAMAQRVGVVVMPFDGPGSDAIRSQVHEALGEDSRLDVAALDEGSPGAQILVSGSTAGRATRRTFEIVASDGEGNELATQSGRVGRGAAGRRAVADATRALLDAAIPRLPPPPAAEVEPDTTDTTPPPEEHHDSAATPSSGSDPAILGLFAGIVAHNRSTGIDLQGGLHRGYDSVYVELAVAGELRPLAHDPSLARGLFVRASYAHAVALGTQYCPMGGSCQRYDTTFFRIYGDVGFLFDLDRVAELGAGLGFGFEANQIADNPILPGVEYPYLRPAIRGRIRILEELLVLDAEVGFRSLFGRDGLNAAYGTGGDSFGMDASLAATGLFDFGLTWRAEFGWSSYWHSFTGGSGQSGTDQALRGTFLLGYGFR
ncbi:MAG: hypothetical protein K1X94_16780 [Sandaracinaceae bacterium]|nr:hypothetical protein [Sandaracinaceae bacterium]